MSVSNDEGILIILISTLKKTFAAGRHIAV